MDWSIGIVNTMYLKLDVKYIDVYSFIVIHFIYSLNLYNISQHKQILFKSTGIEEAQANILQYLCDLRNEGSGEGLV